MDIYSFEICNFLFAWKSQLYFHLKFAIFTLHGNRNFCLKSSLGNFRVVCICFYLFIKHVKFVRSVFLSKSFCFHYFHSSCIYAQSIALVFYPFTKINFCLVERYRHVTLTYDWTHNNSEIVCKRAGYHATVGALSFIHFPVHLYTYKIL